ncbi:FHA domain-containing protein [Desulfobulbus sp. US5]|nr:FHA domain-containing protein [Desulfobulbus sp. US5]
MNIPAIKIQLIHIDGPLKGKIHEFSEDVVLLGRHPECHIVFPETCAAISRKHAEIRREGNRFKLIDKSTNGTLVNGKQQKEVFLKNGDVLILAEKNGPKVSFLTTTGPADDKKSNVPRQKKSSRNLSQRCGPPRHRSSRSYRLLRDALSRRNLLPPWQKASSFNTEPPSSPFNSCRSLSAATTIATAPCHTPPCLPDMPASSFATISIGSKT